MTIDEKIQYRKDVNSPQLIYRVNENPNSRIISFLKINELNRNDVWKCRNPRVGNTKY